MILLITAVILNNDKAAKAPSPPSAEALRGSHLFQMPPTAEYASKCIQHAKASKCFQMHSVQVIANAPVVW